MPLAQILGNRAFGTLVHDAVRRFRFWQYDRTGTAVPDTTWEAYANCFAAGIGTMTWGNVNMELGGRTAEFRSEYLGESSHPQQDAHNQAVRRNFAQRHLDPDAATRAATITPGLQ